MTLDRNRRPHVNRSRGPLAAATGVLAITLVMAIAWTAAIRTGNRTVASPAAGSAAPARSGAGAGLSAYPPPGTPTVTPAPDNGGVFPPPRIDHRIVDRAASPYADLVANLETALAGGAGNAFTPWVDGAGTGLAMEYPGATEGFGVHLDPFSAGNLLDTLFANGSAPVVQGYFEQPGCTGPHSGRTCWPLFLITGWQGPVPMPTKHPAETLGPPPPPDVPVGAAAWEIAPEAGGPYWVSWWLGDGYHSLLERLVAEGHGTYSVLR